MNRNSAQSILLSQQFGSCRIQYAGRRQGSFVLVWAACFSLLSAAGKCMWEPACPQFCFVMSF